MDRRCVGESEGMSMTKIGGPRRESGGGKKLRKMENTSTGSAKM
jgi:hypothetical protein